MFEYVFEHTDKAGNVWKHIHTTILAARAAQRWWSRMALTETCTEVARQPRNALTDRTARIVWVKAPDAFRPIKILLEE